MKSMNALSLRQSLGKVLDRVNRTGEPIIIERGRKRVAALVPIAEFEKRFVDALAIERRRQIAADIERLRVKARPGQPSVVEMIRQLRGPLG